MEFSDPVSETGLISGEREAGFTVWGCWKGTDESLDGNKGCEKVTWRGDEDTASADLPGEER